MISILQDLSPARIALAFDANAASFWQLLFCTYPPATLHNDAGLLWYTTGIRHDVLNAIFSVPPDIIDFPVVINGVVDYFQRSRLPFLCHVGPSAPATLGSHLSTLGMAHYETEPVMAIDLCDFAQDLPTHELLSIHPVTRHEDIEHWIRIWELGSAEDIIQTWTAIYTDSNLGPDSPLRLYLGMIDGKPVAMSGIFFAEGVASIGPLGTLPEYRRQGIAATMMLALLHEASEQGYRVGLLSASQLGISLYRRFGFQEICHTGTYLWHPTY